MKTLICEICKEPIARFNPAELKLPIELSIFKSLYPERSVPDPFPPAMDRWEVAACPRCRRRPFFNHTPTAKGDDYIISTGDRVPEAEIWFVLTLGSSGEIEKLLLSARESEVAPQQDPPEPPPQEHPAPIEPQAEPIETEDQEPTGNYKSPPVICPTCGKQFRSAGRMAKYHSPCPNLPPQEGFKV